MLLVTGGVLFFMAFRVDTAEQFLKIYMAIAVIVVTWLTLTLFTLSVFIFKQWSLVKKLAILMGQASLKTFERQSCFVKFGVASLLSM